MEQERYELPDGWEWKKFPDVVWFQEGPGILKKDFTASGIPLIRISGMSDYHVSLKGCNYLSTDMVNKKWNHFRLQIDDILISTSASMNKISIVGEEAYGAIPYTGLIRFQPNKNLQKKYLYWFFHSNFYSEQIKNNKSGTTIQHYGPTHLKKMVIPLPPLPEQRRIADKLDAVLGRIDDAIRLSQDNLASLDDLFASLLQQAFDPLGKASEETRYELPNGWEWKKLSDILVLHYGKALKTSDRVGGNIKVYGSNGVIDTHNDFLCSYPTVIIGRKGSVGETNLCTDSCWVIDTAFFTEIKDKAKLCLKYFFYFTKTNNVHRLTQNGVKPGINRNDYLNQSIPLPPLPEQRRIADKLDALSGKIALQKRAIEEKLDELNHLKNSVLDAAFRGRL